MNVIRQSPPDWVIVGIPTSGGVVLLASTALSEGQLRTIGGEYQLYGDRVVQVSPSY